MNFSPFNNIVKLCIQGMGMEDQNKPEEALRFFMQAWNEATNDFEKFLAAYYVAHQQKTVPDKLKWLQTAVDCAQKTNDNSAKSAFPSLYSNIAKCYEELGEYENARKNFELSESFRENPSDKGPFYHGTKADLKTGDLLTAGTASNYQSGLIMNHIYFTAIVDGAGLAAALAKGDGLERVYVVEPTGKFENDPNVTDKKFPGNPTRSYRSEAPLKIVGEVKEWARPAPEALEEFRRKLAGSKGNIIN